MTYRAPISEIQAAMRYAMAAASGANNAAFADLDDGMDASILDQAAKYAEGVLAPINRNGDLTPAVCRDGVVTTSPGWKGVLGSGLILTSSPTEATPMTIAPVNARRLSSARLLPIAVDRELTV